ncbi:IS66 family transposase [Calothrix membranacea FACHB-236]|nr:IS66 family transposase [Calothrix membranacea FACHB-236]
MSKNIITSEVVVAYSQCLRKAFLLLFTEDKGTSHEYIRILEQRKSKTREEYITRIKQKNSLVQLYNVKALNRNIDCLIEASLSVNGLEAYCDVLMKGERASSLEQYSYEPAITVGTYSLTKEHKIELLFIGYILEQIQEQPTRNGIIISMGGEVHKLKLTNGYKMLRLLIEPLREWIATPPAEPPPVMLNKHCQYCQFQVECKAKAEKDNDLSLLDRLTAKGIQKYHKKGIFTVKQLSYLFKPRRSRKSKQKLHIQYKPELQALAIRTGKIYLQEIAEISRHQVELFLDIEGIPDQNFQYLIGLLVCEVDKTSYYSFWADSICEEEQIWMQFLMKVSEYPLSPIYHYGSYEPKVINQFTKKYQVDGESLNNRLVNINTYIYGKIYFPVMSNSLKKIGKFLGASWTVPNASGLQSLVWRYQWETTRNPDYKQMLVTYNEEDCRALKLLTNALYHIKDVAEIENNIDFVNQPKQISTELGEQIHNQFEAILKLAYTNYTNKKISLHNNQTKDNTPNKEGGVKKITQKYKKRLYSKPNKVIQLLHGANCPYCKDKPLQTSQRISEKFVIDFIYTKNGCRKIIIKYTGLKGYCSKCGKYFSPPGLYDRARPQVFGHGFKAMVIYQRLALRLPYDLIIQSMKEQFAIEVSMGTIINCLNYFANYYTDTEKTLLQHILESPFVHVDETQISIRGNEQYVWVFTDGKYVIFKLTETRESKIVHELLSEYNGVLVSDFYPGYDSMKCRQQKCWVHLIRDLNDELWKAPFDAEFELFVSRVKILITPILEHKNNYALNKRTSNQFRKLVEQFYTETINNKIYYSEITVKYQKRFERYKESLFTFLEQDIIPWHNNTAERALRHLAVQRKISGFFYESGANYYLTLLGITQTCRFQDKSLLKFLMSGEKDIDKFKASKRTKDTELVGVSRNKKPTL